MSEQFKYQQALELIAQDCDREAKMFFDVGMTTPGSVYAFVAKRLREAAKKPMVTKLTPLFSHAERGTY